MSNSETDRPRSDAEEGLATVRKPWATPRVIASVDPRYAEHKHLYMITDSHSPSGSTNSYS